MANDGGWSSAALESGVGRVTVRPGRIDGAVATALIRELHRELKERYGGGDTARIDPARFLPPTGAFLIAYVDGHPAGCAGLQKGDETTGELKRMVVRRRFRRSGIGSILLRAVEDKARDLGYQALRIETGARQPDAIALYRSAGYREVEPFPLHADDPDGVFLRKEL